MKSTAARIALIYLSLGSIAGAEPIVSGPKPGTPLTPVMVYDAVGTFAGQEFDAAAEIGPNPGALLFVNSATRNTYPVIRGIDQLAGRNALMGFKSFTIYLAADRTAAENRVRLRNGLATGGHKFSVTGKFGALKLENPIMLGLDGLDGPGNYALNRRAVLTLVMTRDGKVHSSHTFTDTGEQDLPLIEQWVSEVVGPIPQALSEQRMLRDARLPREKDRLRKLAVQFQAFWGREFRRGHPMQPVIEEITGTLPTPEEALNEVVGWWLPNEMQDLRAMAMRQAEELFHLQTRLNAAKAGQLLYTAMKTTQIRRAMQRPAMAAELRASKGDDKLQPQAARTGKQPQSRAGRAVGPTAKGKPPTDAQLNSLMRSFMRKTNSRQPNGAIFADIQSRSRDSAELREQSVAMFQFLLSSDGRYGNDDALDLAQRFLGHAAESDSNRNN